MSVYSLESNGKVPTAETVRRVVGFVTKNGNMYERTPKHSYELCMKDGRPAIVHRLESGAKLGGPIFCSSIMEYHFEKESDIPKSPYRKSTDSVKIFGQTRFVSLGNYDVNSHEADFKRFIAERKESFKNRFMTLSISDVKQDENHFHFKYTLTEDAE